MQSSSSTTWMARCGSGRPLPPDRVACRRRRRSTRPSAPRSTRTSSAPACRTSPRTRRAPARGSRRRRSTPRRGTRGRRARRRRRRASEWMSAGGPFQTVTRSARIHSATPTGSLRSKTIAHPPACAVRQRGEHLHVEDGEREEVALAQRRPPAAARAEHRARHQQVVLAVHRALRVAGGATRVRDARRARTDRRRLRTAHRARPRARRATPPARPRSSRTRARRSPSPAPRSRRRTAAATTPLSSSRNCFSGGASARLRPTQTAPRRIAPWKARITSRSLGRRTGDPVAGAHAERGERVRGAVGEPVELGVRPATRPRDQRLAIGIDRATTGCEDAATVPRRPTTPTSTAHARSTCRCCSSTIIGSR